MTEPSAAESASKEQIPRQEDMNEVIALSQRVAQIEQELELARLQLRDAWARVPVDPAILRQPYRSDIPVTCVECGRPTRWRTGKGHAHCQPECKVQAEARKTTVGIPQAVWDILDGVVAIGEENLDDD